MSHIEVRFVDGIRPPDRDALVVRVHVYRDAEFWQSASASISGTDLLGVDPGVRDAQLVAALASEAASQIVGLVAVGGLQAPALGQPAHVPVVASEAVERIQPGGEPVEEGAVLATFDLAPTGHELSEPALRILQEFQRRGLGAGAMIEQWDFGDAIVWEGGSVRDDEVRAALRALFDDSLLIEHNAAFELTEAGAAVVSVR